jgi:hypothetical protein
MNLSWLWIAHGAAGLDRPEGAMKSKQVDHP